MRLSQVPPIGRRRCSPTPPGSSHSVICRPLRQEGSRPFAGKVYAPPRQRLARFAPSRKLTHGIAAESMHLSRPEHRHLRAMRATGWTRLEQRNWPVQTNGAEPTLRLVASSMTVRIGAVPPFERGCRCCRLSSSWIFDFDTIQARRHESRDRLTNSEMKALNAASVDLVGMPIADLRRRLYLPSIGRKLTG
jgi:hypothetical protein